MKADNVKKLRQEVKDLMDRVQDEINPVDTDKNLFMERARQDLTGHLHEAASLLHLFWTVAPN